MTIYKGGRGGGGRGELLEPLKIKLENLSLGNKSSQILAD